MNYILFNGKHSYFDLGLKLETPSIPSINEEVESIKVEGRNGNLTIKKGNYMDRIIDLKFSSVRKVDEDIESFFNRIDDINLWLEDIDSNDLIIYLRPNKKYVVKSINKDILNIKNYNIVEINIEFTCEPFMYELNEKYVELTKNECIHNCGSVKCEPNIKIYGNGNIQLTVNNETVQINNVNEYVELDSKLLLCLNKDKTSKSRDMIGHFPLLAKGSNNINWIGNVSKVEVLPRTAYK